MESLTTNLTSLLGAVSSVMSLFTEFPMNLFLAGSVAGIAFGIFRKAKGSARG